MSIVELNAKFQFSAAIRSVRWIREAVLIIDTRHPELIPPPRVTLFQNGSLQVRNLKPEDTGEYICEIKTVEGELATQLHAIEVQCSLIFLLT